MAVGTLTRINIPPFLITNSEVTNYTVPTSQKAIYVELHLCNTDDTTEYMAEVHFVESGGSRTPTNQVINQVSAVSSLRAGEARTYSWNPFLAAGDSVRTIASTTNKISARLAVVLEEV